MKIELVRLNQYKGNKAIFYSVKIDDENSTLFEKFIKENINSNLKELLNLDSKIRVMNEDLGARSHFFKLKEGRPGDGVAAIYDMPLKKFRLYCLRYGSTTVILGGGGIKRTRTHQEDIKLHKEVEILSKLSIIITTAMKEKDIKLEQDGSFSGSLTIED